MSKDANSQSQSGSVDLHACNLRDVAMSAFLYGSSADALGSQISPEAFKKYRDQLLEDFGAPRDPAEEMLVEQLALAHLNVGRLMLKSAMAENHEAGVAYAAAGTRLMGEFRRCTLALQDYRERTAGPRGVVGGTEPEQMSLSEKRLRKAK